ncbi:MAG TPA: phospholipase D family protein [Acidobacteriaceae bacterium]|nr:phospholipase D family protein [Acidobacteriaceae bacterium]
MRRMWIISPYIGRERAVERLLAAPSRRPKLDIRIITDLTNDGFVDVATLRRLTKNSGVSSIKKLSGVHAKMYLFDEDAFVGSSNLTQLAFTSRYEVLIFVCGNEAESCRQYFRFLWKEACPCSDADLRKLQRNSHVSKKTEEPTATKCRFAQRWGLPEAQDDRRKLRRLPRDHSPITIRRFRFMARLAARLRSASPPQAISMPELARRLNRRHLFTRGGRPYSGKRGTYTMVKAAYQWVREEMGAQTASEIAYAFTKPDGTLAWDSGRE